MIDQELIDIFDDCLNRLAAGETVEQVLRRYAAYDADLRPLLQTVRLAQRALPVVDEVAPGMARGRERLLAELNARPVRATRRQAAAPRWWLAVAALLLVCLGLGAVTANSLPGDPLYSLKRGVENVATSLSADPQAAEEAARQRRIDEIYMLIALGRPAEVEFRGNVEALAADRWQVSSLTVLLNAETQRPESVRLGARVAVRADVTAERTLVAHEIRLLQPEQVEITPEATTEPVTATVALSATPQPTQTATTTPPPTDTATATTSATPTQTATLTRTSSPTATQTPAETLLPSQRAGCTTLRPDGWVTYSVRAGDSLSGLASATGTTVETIVELNCLPESGLILVNQPLYLPLTPPTRAPAADAPAPTAASQPGVANPPALAGDNNDDDDDDDDDDNSGPGNNDDDDDDDDNSGPGSNDDDD